MHSFPLKQTTYLETRLARFKTESSPLSLSLSLYIYIYIYIYIMVHMRRQESLQKSDTYHEERKGFYKARNGEIAV
jgi:hypothetical protein